MEYEKVCHIDRLHGASFISGSFAVRAMTAEEIIRLRDNNEYVKTAIAESEMMIVSGNRKMSKTMISYAQEENALTVSPIPDRELSFSRGAMIFGCSFLMLRIL